MNRLLFRGFKTFWKTKSSIELVILEYPSQDLYEIIAFDPVLRKHAPRLYVDKHAAKYIILGEDETNKKQYVLLDEVVTMFLFNHIILTEYLPQSGFIKIDIRPFFYSEHRFTSELELVVQRPLNISFYPSPFQENDSRRSSTSVYEMGCVRHLNLSLRDKWRLPLILVRVSKSLPLRESDAKIWACFVHNKTQDEVLNSMAVSLAKCFPMESRHVLRSAAHSALLPQLCPFPGSRSGTITPLTLSGRSTSSASCRSSPTSSRSPSPGLIRLSTSTSLQPSVVDSPAGGAAVGSIQQRSPAKPGLPPLTPNTLSRRSDQEPTRSRTTDTLPVEQQTHQRRVHSLGNMWPVRLTRAALSSVSASLSASSSPQLSPRTIAPISGEVDSAEEEDMVFAELGRNFGAVGNARSRRLAALESSTRLSHEHLQSRQDYPQGNVSSPSSSNIVRLASWREVSGFSEWARFLLQQPAQIQIAPVNTEVNTDVTIDIATTIV